MVIVGRFRESIIQHSYIVHFKIIVNLWIDLNCHLTLFHPVNAYKIGTAGNDVVTSAAQGQANFILTTSPNSIYNFFAVIHVWDNGFCIFRGQISAVGELFVKLDECHSDVSM